MTKSLRRAVDLSTILAAVALTAVLGWHFSGQFRRDQSVHATQESLRAFEKMLAMRSAAKDTALTKTGWPATIDVTWFAGAPPLNSLLTPDRPWVEVATPEEAHMRDPNTRAAVSYQTASFWYNPYLGIVRARVPYEFNDEKSRELYNQVNSTSVASIYGTEMPRFEEAIFGPPAELAGSRTEVAGASTEPEPVEQPE
ncbi:MAG: hypothetical protein KF678_08845 [Phycisphaeraceae bacterium]|nr:hypothetical protein [Phycisphaeraceae bacterium]